MNTIPAINPLKIDRDGNKQRINIAKKKTPILANQGLRIL